LQLIGEQWITPVDLWFVRNHHPVPAISEHSYRLKLKMALREDRFGTNVVKTLALADLKKFQKHTIVSSVQCGGNRRSEMDKIAKTAGTSWGVAAISTAEWSGALLRDVLQFLDSGDYEEAGYSHVMFSALEGLQASVPLHKAISRRGDVLLAYEMNGKPLEPQHGFPVRVIVPGHAGVRNVKWVTEIEVSDEEADGPWQRGMSYKGFNPSVGSLEGVDVSKIPSLQEMPVQSAITSPSYQANLPLTPGNETVKGYAYSGGGRAIIRVDVSADGGKSWKEAELLEGSSQPLDRAWAWTFWECDVDIPELPEGVEKSTVQLISRAVDASHNTQPDTVEGIWNLRGINNNAWHRVTLPLVTDDDDD
jgi:sulfite oxidase